MVGGGWSLRYIESRVPFPFLVDGPRVFLLTGSLFQSIHSLALSPIIRGLPNNKKRGLLCTWCSSLTTVYPIHASTPSHRHSTTTQLLYLT